MPKEWTDCVKSVIESGKSTKEAYAICTAAFIKKHGVSPQEAEKKGMLDGIFKELSFEDLELLLGEAEVICSNENAPSLEWFVNNIKLYQLAQLQEKAGENVKDIYERTFQMPEAFFQTVSPEIPLEENSETIKIQVLRKGAFKHPQYGKINFDDKTFDSFIKNFESQVPQEHIAYDFKHNPDYGAAAWVKRIFVEGDGLWADVVLTKRGAEALKNREFIYFSTEYVDDYKDRESGKSYGPTILGGGMTNRPFIKGMAPVLMSEDAKNEFTFIEEPTTEEQIGGNMDEILKEIAALRAEFAAQIESAQNKDEIQKAFETFGVQIKSLEEKLDATVKADADKAKALEAVQEDANRIKAELEAKDEKVKSLTESLENTIREKDAKEEELKSHRKELHAKNVELFCKELSDKGLWPSTVEVVKELMAVSSGEKVITLSEGEGENKKEVEVDLRGIITKIVDSIPDDFKVSMQENTEHGDKGDYTADKITKLADEAGISYAEMLVKLSTEKKI